MKDKKITTWDKEKLRHLISGVYYASEEPHSSSAVIDQTTNFLDNLHYKALKAQKTELEKKVEEAIDKMWDKRETDKNRYSVGWNSALTELETRLKLTY